MDERLDRYALTFIDFILTTNGIFLFVMCMSALVLHMDVRSRASFALFIGLAMMAVTETSDVINLRRLFPPNHIVSLAAERIFFDVGVVISLSGFGGLAFGARRSGAGPTARQEEQV